MECIAKNVSKNGNVNYKGISKDSKNCRPTLMNYRAMSLLNHGLKMLHLPIGSMHTMHTVKLILDNYPTKSIKDINDPWGKKFFP
jgi:hypothetical protein